MLFDHVLAVELAVINSAGADTIGKQRGKNPYVVRTEIIGEWDCLGWSPHLQCGIQMSSNLIFSTILLRDSSVVEHRVHTPKVVSAILAPASIFPSLAQLDRVLGFYPRCWGFDSLTTDQIIFARVAQLVEAAVLEAVQCGFESHLAHQKLW